MDVNILAVDFEVDPIDDEALNEAQDCFSEERIKSKGSGILVQGRAHFVAYDKSYELFCPLTLVFYIDGRVKLEVLIIPYFEALGKPPCVALQEDRPGHAKRVCGGLSTEHCAR